MATHPYEPGELDDTLLGVEADRPTAPRPRVEPDEPTAVNDDEEVED